MKESRRALVTGASLFVVAGVVRCAYVWSVADHPSVRFPIGDSLAYHQAALEILGGNWLGDEIFYQDPLYPYLLAILYGLFGIGSTGVLIAQSWIDCISVLFVYATARRVFGDRCALVAGLLAAFYKVFLFYDAFLLKVPLTLLLASATAYLLVRAEQSRSARAWWAAGFALGLAALTRGNYLVFVPILVAWIAWIPARDRRFRLTAAAGALIGLTLAIAPVTLRNYAVGGDFVLITSQAGQNFYIGNYRGNEAGVYNAPPFVVANAAHEQSDFREEGERRAGHSLSPSELSRLWFREAFAEIGADPGHFVRHTWRKLLLFFNHYEVPDNQSLAFFEQEVAPALRLALPAYGWVLPLALCGVVLARRRRITWLLVLFFASYAASVVSFFNVSRYRIPAVPVVLVFASYALCELGASLARREWRRVAALAAGVAAGLVLSWWPLVDEDFALLHSNLGAAYLRQAEARHTLAIATDRAGDAEAADALRADAEVLWDSAEDEFRKGLDIRRHDPRLRSALKGLLVSRIEKERGLEHPTRALAITQRLTATFPGFAVGYSIEGELHEQLGALDEAVRAFSRAVSVSPGDRRAAAGLARIAAQRRETVTTP